ncbi:MAG: energy-coupling factor ABC transporter permease [Desulfuromonadales bacterium]|nr:energy-coupling factor ABC transporter permease [Desulfuromonadales bacterium]
MHMADALLSPAVGGTMCAATAGTIAWCSAKVRKDLEEHKVPLMGVLGAFIFAAQMINFAIPATGSSGHLGGGLLLAILLGPHAAFLTIASVLFIQALFFADGGLLALGCNIFNLGFFQVFIAYPLLYRKLAGRRPSQGRMILAALIAATVGLQLAAFAVVLETTASGISALPFKAFVLLMQPIHLPIGVIEGLATAAVVAFVYRARPELIESTLAERHMGKFPIRGMLVGFSLAALLLGGGVSWFASTQPDGLEWAISKVAGTDELPAPVHPLHSTLADIQDKMAIFSSDTERTEPDDSGKLAATGSSPIDTGLPGLVGGITTLAACLLAGVLLRSFARRA